MSDLISLSILALVGIVVTFVDKPCRLTVRVCDDTEPLPALPEHLRFRVDAHYRSMIGGLE